MLNALFTTPEQKKNFRALFSLRDKNCFIWTSCCRINQPINCEQESLETGYFSLLQLTKTIFCAIYVKCTQKENPYCYFLVITYKSKLSNIVKPPAFRIHASKTFLSNSATKIPFMNSFSGNCAATVPISTFVCLWAIYIYSQDRSTYFPVAE